MTDSSSRQNSENQSSSSFEKLFDKYYQLLCLFAFKYVKNMEIARDIVQEVFVRLWEKRHSIEFTAAIKSWLYRAVSNSCIDYLRHQKIKETHYLTASPADFPDDPQKKIEQAELDNSIHEAIRKLPDGCRKIFKMSRFEEMKYKEIAEKLGISEKTVEAQMGKALRLLRISLRDEIESRKIQ